MITATTTVLHTSATMEVLMSVFVKRPIRLIGTSRHIFFPIFQIAKLKPIFRIICILTVKCIIMLIVPPLITIWTIVILIKLVSSLVLTSIFG